MHKKIKTTTWGGWIISSWIPYSVLILINNWPFGDLYLVIQYIRLIIYSSSQGDSKVPFSIATIPRCRGVRYSFPRISPLYPWCVSNNAEC